MKKCLSIKFVVTEKVLMWCFAVLQTSQDQI